MFFFPFVTKITSFVYRLQLIQINYIFLHEILKIVKLFKIIFTWLIKLNRNYFSLKDNCNCKALTFCFVSSIKLVREICPQLIWIGKTRWKWRSKLSNWWTRTLFDQQSTFSSSFYSCIYIYKPFVLLSFHSFEHSIFTICARFFVLLLSYKYRVFSSSSGSF